jgi:hypothetical protein
MRELLRQQIELAGEDPEQVLAEAAFAFAVHGATGEEPKTAAEALSGPDAHLWKESIQKEMQAMRDFGVWDPELVELPKGKTAVDSKLLFKHKKDESGRIVKYKTRFVARGFSQRAGEDYGQTYSSVAKLASVRLLLALAASHGWHAHVVDVDFAFLNAPLKEEIYLRQPAGADDGTGKVYRLRRALYGLKQAPKAWNEELGSHLMSQGFEKSASDDALYIQWDGESFSFVPCWVDDLLIVSNSERQTSKVKEILSSKYSIKDLGQVTTYLGMQVKRDKGEKTLEISLERYVQGLAVKYAKVLEGTSKVQTPFAPDSLHKIRNGGWSVEEAQRVPTEHFLSVVGSLMYAATAARPDLSFTVSTLAQASADPRAIHMKAAVRALRYLVDTADMCLRYDGHLGHEVVGYTDADWASEADGQSRAAYVFKLAGGAITWATKKVESISDSTSVAEYKALTLGAKEAIWLRQLMGELKQSTKAITLMCDNQSSIKLAHNPVHHQRTKHVKVAWHFIRQAIKDGDVTVEFVRTLLQDADIFTKALDGPKHKANRERLGLLSPSTRRSLGLSSLLEGVLEA